MREGGLYRRSSPDAEAVLIHRTLPAGHRPDAGGTSGTGSRSEGVSEGPRAAAPAETAAGDGAGGPEPLAADAPSPADDPPATDDPPASAPSSRPRFSTRKEG